MSDRRAGAEAQRVDSDSWVCDLRWALLGPFVEPVHQIVCRSCGQPARRNRAAIHAEDVQDSATWIRPDRLLRSALKNVLAKADLSERRLLTGSPRH
jgi:hypothetical protein